MGAKKPVKLGKMVAVPNKKLATSGMEG